MSLIATYLSRFGSSQEALDAMNEALGTSYRHNALSRWKREEETGRGPSKAARRYMLATVLPEVLQQHGRGHKRDVAAALDKLS